MRLVERERARTVIDAAVDRLAAGRGAVLGVEGAPGTGKTALLDVLGEQARERGMAVRAARACEQERSVPFGLAEQLVPGVGPTGATTADPQRARIVALAAAVVAPAHEADRPVVLVADDLHWSDDASLAFLVHLAVRAEGARVLLAAAWRPDDPAAIAPPFDALRRVATVLRPGLLSRAGVAQVVRASLADAGADLVDACADATGGNPFLLHTLLRSLAEDGVPADLDELAHRAPDAVLRSVVARTVRDGPDAVAVARAVAILGDGADQRLVAALADRDIEVVEDVADRLARSGVLATAEHLAVAHPLVGAALRTDLGTFGRRRWHRRAAALLSAADADDSRVAVHLLAVPATGDHADAAVLHRAGTDALRRGDPPTAVALLRRALAEDPPPDRLPGLLLDLARAETLCGAPEAAGTTERALAHVVDPIDRAEALGVLAMLAETRGDADVAVALARRARSTLPEAHPSRPRLLATELGAALQRAELAPVAAAVLGPLRTAAADGDMPVDPVLAAHLAGAFGVDGDRALVRALAERAVAADPLIDPLPQGQAIGWLGSALIWVDELDLAARWLDEAVAEAQRRGAVLAGATARLQRGWVGLVAGRLTDAVEDASAAMELYRDGWVGSPWSSPFLVGAHVERGDLVAAAAALATGEQAGDDRPEHLLLMAARSDLELARGEPGAALATALATGEQARARSAREDVRIVEWRPRAARAAHALDDGARARELVAPAVRALRVLGPGRQLAVALTVAGAVAADAGEGLVLVEEAACLLRDSPAVLDRARALVGLGRARRHAGRPEHEAAEPLYTALEIAGQTGAVPLADAARDELRRLGRRPRRTDRQGPRALSPGERRVVDEAARGASTRHIAGMLHLSTKTVETHLSNAYRKLGVRRRADLARALSSPEPTR